MKAWFDIELSTIDHDRIVARFLCPILRRELEIELSHLVELFVICTQSGEQSNFPSGTFQRCV
jgi:hypothetical protein